MCDDNVANCVFEHACVSGDGNSTGVTNLISLSNPV